MTDAERLADILARIDRIQRATSGGEHEFLDSEIIQDAVVRNLEVIGEASKHLTVATKHRYPEVPWREIGKFRDLAIHHGKILTEAVWETVSKDLPRIKRMVSRAVATDP